MAESVTLVEKHFTRDGLGVFVTVNAMGKKYDGLIENPCIEGKSEDEIFRAFVRGLQFAFAHAGGRLMDWAASKQKTVGYLGDSSPSDKITRAVACFIVQSNFLSGAVNWENVPNTVWSQ
jgi:hypothetical protein